MLSAFLFAALALEDSNKPQCSEAHLNQASLVNLAVMPESNPETKTDPAAAGGKPIGYTRLRLKYTSCVSEQMRSYEDEERHWFIRMFDGRTDNHVLKFDAEVAPVGVKKSVQLYSMVRSNLKEGQTWTTDVRNNDFLLPYFRLDRNSVLNFSANFQSEGASKLDFARTALDIVDRGSKLLTPTALLITDENKPRFNAAATFVDESLSKLFYKKVTETASQGIAINLDASGEKHLATIILLAPHPTKTYPTEALKGRLIGRWDVVADPLVKSLFVPFTNDAPDYSTLDAATVLNLKVSDEHTLRQRLSGSEPVSEAARRLAAADTGDIEGPAISFCRLVAAEAAKIGLAPYDVAIATWAYLADQALINGKHKLAHGACGAVEFLPPWKEKKLEQESQLAAFDG